MKRTIACTILALSSFTFGCAAEPADEEPAPAIKESASANDVNVDVNTDTTDPAMLPRVSIEGGCVRIGNFTCCAPTGRVLCIGDAEME